MYFHENLNVSLVPSWEAVQFSSSKKKRMWKALLISILLCPACRKIFLTFKTW